MSPSAWSPASSTALFTCALGSGDSYSMPVRNPPEHADRRVAVVGAHVGAHQAQRHAHPLHGPPAKAVRRRPGPPRTPAPPGPRPAGAWWSPSCRSTAGSSGGCSDCQPGPVEHAARRWAQVVVLGRAAKARQVDAQLGEQAGQARRPSSARRATAAGRGARSLPSAVHARISHRCAIDLSPGTRTSPRERAGRPAGDEPHASRPTS